MLDMKLFREDPEAVFESEKKRYKDVKNAELVIEYDRKWRDVLKKAEDLKRHRNVVTREIAELKKASKPAEAKIHEMKKVNEGIKKNDELAEELLKKRDEHRYKVGNIILKDTPVGKTEHENRMIRCWGEAHVYKDDEEEFKRETKGKMKHKVISWKPKSHVDLLADLKLGDLEKASVVSGSRFYYLSNELVLLNMSLMRFAMDHLVREKLVPMWTPFMLTREAIAAAAELSDFENTLYKIEGEELYLIATAEQTLAAFHMGETFDEADLPKAYAGFSTNFRREAGAHGKDTKGIFRVHQFDKVEQFVFCVPEESPAWFEKLISNAEKIFQDLGIPYRVMSICSGEMNDNAAIKYDIEAWMPAQGKFREVVSCSNCTDYQARKLGVQVRRGSDKVVVHTLNSTAVATERALVAIMENFQNEKGEITVPHSLARYAGFEKIAKKK
jgi:seryl-tRNA synthetase